MNVTWRGDALCITGISFDAQLTLIDSAQSFTWREHEGVYYNVIGGEAVALSPVAGGVQLYPVAEEHIEDVLCYLDLLRDYDALGRKYAAHPQIGRALDLLPGLRVLNQPVWDTLLSFIISANNNVPRIRRLVWLLGEHHGAPRMLDGLVLRALPTAEALAQVPQQALRELGFGYRAPFLVDTARMVASGFPLDALRDLSYDEAHRRLVQLPGVGDKVADCVQLFSLGQAEAFPVDVWVDRLMRAWFPEMNHLKTRAALQAAARKQFGPDAGIIQQFLFHCARCGLMEV